MRFRTGWFARCAGISKTDLLVISCIPCDLVTNPYGASRRGKWWGQLLRNSWWCSNILLKNMPRRAAVYLTYVFNSRIKLCSSPNTWNHASVIPITKPGKDHSNLLNSISLLSSVSKIIEKIILKRLQDLCSTNNVLPDNQFGFSMAHSTSHQLRKVVQNVKGKKDANA
jgi:hypothetical protein